jgi:ADP-ribose pyrophosphatase
VSGGFTKLGDVELVRAHVFRVVRATFRGPGGDEFERHLVYHPGAVGVLPLHDDDTVTLVRQYRPALEDDLLEVPAGICDVRGEDPALTGLRELGEEAGLSAARIEHLVTCYAAPGMSDETIALYLATDLTDIAHDRQSAEEHAMDVERIPLDEALAMIDDGRIVDSKTIIALTLTARRH